MPHQPHALRIDLPFCEGRLDSGHHAPHGRGARLAVAIDNVGLEHEIPVLREDGHVVQLTLVGRDVVVHPGRQALVDVDDHGIAPAGLEARRVEERALHPSA